MKRFEVHKDAMLVLSFSTEPGVLLSTAVRPPGFKPPSHPFVNAQSHDAQQEHHLADLLRQAKSAEDFIVLLERDGYEVSNR